MLPRHFLLCLFAVLLAEPFAAQQPLLQPVPQIAGLPQGAREAAASIDPEKIRAHVRFLSLDLLEGRGPGKRGAELAAEYIATQFALAGVEPAGDDGTYFQKVPLLAVHTVEDKTHFSFVPAHGQPIDLAYGTEIVSKDQTGAETADFDAPIVFVGYGIHAPEYHWDDYAGPDGKEIDLKGKVALVIVNEPPSDDEKFFKGKALTYYGRWTYKYEEAARRGAVGVLIIHRTDLASYGWEVVRNSQAVEKSYLQGDPDATLRAAAWIQHETAQKLLTLAGLGDLDEAIDRAGKPGRSMQLSFRYGCMPTLRAGCGATSARMWWAAWRAPALRIRQFFIRRITTIWASTPTPRATTSTTARPTTVRAAGFYWRWRGRSRNLRCVRPMRSTLPR